MSEAPHFSVIIPTHDRLQLLCRCLRSVLAQGLPPSRYEIVVVDDGSRRATRRALEPFLSGGQVRMVRQRQQGWGAARRLGAQESRGAILVFLDNDCVAPPGWLATYARTYAHHPGVGGVAGGLRCGARTNVAGRKQYLGHRAYFNRLNAPLGSDVDHPGRAWFTFGGNRSFRRELWWSVQPEEPLWYFDDYAIDLALRELDAVIYYEPAAWVTHHYVLSVAQRVRSAFRYGRSEVGREVPPVGNAESLTLRERWARLRLESPASSIWAWSGYALTQPLVWVARYLGQRHAQIRKRSSFPFL